MNRRNFLQTMLGASVIVNQSAAALLLSGQGDVIVSVCLGTGTAGIDLRLFKTYTQPLTNVLGNKMGKKVYAESYRSFALIKDAITNNRSDILIVPPMVAIHAMQYGYQPLVRVKDLATGLLVKRKGSQVMRIGIMEFDSWLGAMGRNVIAEHKLGSPAMLETVKTQDAVVSLLEQKAVQAGVLRTEKASKLIATGEYEAWDTLPVSPDFTVLIHDKLVANYGEIVRQTMLNLPVAAVNNLQAAIHVPVKQFVDCTKKDYAALAKAIGEKFSA